MKLKNLTKGINLVLLLITVLSLSTLTIVLTRVKTPQQTTVSAAGFDQFGYNYTARLFNGTGNQWCLKKGLGNNCLGIYSNDKLVMKWNAEWDRGNTENWAKPPYAAKLDNEWNGLGNTGGSGEIWHYKIKWIGSCGADYTRLADGGYCIWGQFETVMDQGKDPNVGPGHLWFAHAKPTGYGF